MAYNSYDNFLGSAAKRAIADNPQYQVLLSKLENTASENSYFLYDAENSPLRSTQQLNVDWSKFENHTFFSSAEVNVNVAFDNIINRFPFDGTRSEVDDFFSKLTGFEKWVYDQFPKNKGSLAFDGSSYITVADTAGVLFPTLSKNKSGAAVISPDSSTSISVEMQLFLPAAANNDQVIFQKSSGSNGISLHLLASPSVDDVTCEFLVMSSSTFVSSSAILKKGSYNHICAIVDRSQDILSLYVSESLSSTSSLFSFSTIDAISAPLLIGSGSNIATFAPTQTLSGSIDEFRVFHSVRSVDDQKKYAQRSIYAAPDLKLYYKFNEPPPPIADGSTNAIVLDSSGNSLHSTITNFSPGLRVKFEDDPLNPMTLEKTSQNPVLFPAYGEVVLLNQTLLSSATLYDQANPNLITRLIPPHFLLEGSNEDGFGLNVDGNAIDEYGGSGGPGSGKLGSQQTLLSFLYIWSKSFDEVKMFVDSFGTLEFVDYDTNDTVPDNFLTALIKRRGLNLPSFFTDSTLEQYLDGDNYDMDYSSSESNLRYVQNQLKRRILISLPKILASKGTQYSIKAFLRAIGIDPDNTVRLREYGGPRSAPLSYARDDGNEVGLMLLSNNATIVKSQFLSASRIEPGFPEVVGTADDGLLTSGSWSYEATYKLPSSLLGNTLSDISLARIVTTGSSIAPGPWLVSNVISTPASSTLDNNFLTLHLCASSGSSPTLSLTLPLSGAGIHDGRRWTVSFGCVRYDDPVYFDAFTDVTSSVSSTYYLRAATQANGEIQESYATSSFFYEVSPGYDNVLRKLSDYNVSGAYVEFGGNSAFAGPDFLTGSQATTNFAGMLSNVRFWSRATTLTEWYEHARNYRSVGADLPYINYNYVTSLSGSFGKLRLDCIHKQDNLLASGVNGEFLFPDYSENENSMLGSGFSTTTSNFFVEVFDHSRLSPYFDEPSTNVKVRARGISDDATRALMPWADKTPTYKSPVYDHVIDDPRFSVDFSLIDALNKDIVTIFSSHEGMNDHIGSPNLLFASDYPDLERLRRVYFARLSGPISFNKFFEFYRWFDASIGDFIAQLLPKKTIFKGVNFLVESHMLERGKHRYYFDENYRLYNSSFAFSSDARVQFANTIANGQIRRY